MKKKAAIEEFKVVVSGVGFSRDGKKHALPAHDASESWHKQTGKPKQRRKSA